MKVSVVTVCFNASNSILKTINSVNLQNFSNVEHIFIDGLSADNTVEIITTSSLRRSVVISEPDLGIYDAMNKGLRAASGDIILFLNSGDVFSNPFILDAYVSSFLNVRTQVVYGSIRYVRSDADIGKWDPGLFYPKALTKGFHVPHPSFCARKSVYSKFGGYDLSFSVASDFDLMLRIFSDLDEDEVCYLEQDVVLMDAIGYSSGISAIFRGFGDVRRSYSKNGYNVSIFSVIFHRYGPKLFRKLRTFFHFLAND